MARLGCKCGTTLWNGLTPNDILLYVYSDKKMDKIREYDSVDTIELSNLEDFEVWLCPECKRLYVFENGSDSVKCVYQLETE